MATKTLVSLCAVAALLAACSKGNDQSGTYSQSEGGTGTATEKDPAAPGDTSTSPGGTAGDAHNTPPPADSLPSAETQPQPSNPPQ
jgi:hypothetical protein